MKRNKRNRVFHHDDDASLLGTPDRSEAHRTSICLPALSRSLYQTASTASALRSRCWLLGFVLFCCCCCCSGTPSVSTGFGRSRRPVTRTLQRPLCHCLDARGAGDRSGRGPAERLAVKTAARTQVRSRRLLTESFWLAPPVRRRAAARSDRAKSAAGVVGRASLKMQSSGRRDLAGCGESRAPIGRCPGAGHLIKNRKTHARFSFTVHPSRCAFVLSPQK